MKDARHDAVAFPDHPDDLPRAGRESQIGAVPEKESRRDAARSALALGLAVAAVALAALPLTGAALALALYAAAAAGAVAAAPCGPFGTANRITLLRAGGAAIFAALVLAPDRLAGAEGWIAAAAGAILLALDGVDGWFARREGRASAYGARLDMEVDAATMLALCALLLALGKAGPWILAIGLMRYAFVAAGLAVPRLARPLPPSNRRRAVCAIQVGTLTLLLAPPIGPPASAAIAAVALAVLAWSFALDLRRLLR